MPTSLEGAELDEALLIGTNLAGVILERADLQRASLIGTQLSAKRFHRGKIPLNLKGTNLSNATILSINKIEEGEVEIDSATNMENLITDSQDLSDYINNEGIKIKGFPILCTSRDDIKFNMRKAGQREDLVNNIFFMEDAFGIH